MCERVTTTPKPEENKVDVLLVSIDELFKYLGDDKMSIALKSIADFVNKRNPGDKQMLSVSTEDIASKYDSIVALQLPETTQDATDTTDIDTEYIESRLIGYVGAMTPIEHNSSDSTRLMSEVGSLKVSSELRGHGIGTILFERIIKAMQDEGITPYAFCNSDSLPIAERLGGHEIKSADEVPREALELCQDCPLYGKTSGKNYSCCDTVVVWDTLTETN